MVIFEFMNCYQFRMKKQILVFMVLLLPLYAQAGFKKSVVLVGSKSGNSFSVERVENDNTLFWLHEVGPEHETHFQFRSIIKKIDPSKLDVYLNNGEVIYDGAIIYNEGKKNTIEGTLKANLPQGEWSITLPTGELTNRINFTREDGKVSCAFFAANGQLQREVVLEKQKGMSTRVVSQKTKFVSPKKTVKSILKTASLIGNWTSTIGKFAFVEDRYYYPNAQLQAEYIYNNKGLTELHYWNAEGVEQPVKLNEELNILKVPVLELQSLLQSFSEDTIEGANVQMIYDDNTQLKRFTLEKKDPLTISLSETQQPDLHFNFGTETVPFVLNFRTEDVLIADTLSSPQFELSWEYYHQEGWKRTIKLFPEVTYDGPFFMVVEKMPQFPGGDAALMSYLGQHIKYPEAALKLGAEGRVYVSFIVTPSGKLANVMVGRSVQTDLDKEAVRVVRSMPNWVPGVQRGKIVAVKYMLPIMFKM